MRLNRLNQQATKFEIEKVKHNANIFLQYADMEILRSNSYRSECGGLRIFGLT